MTRSLLSLGHRDHPTRGLRFLLEAFSLPLVSGGFARHAVWLEQEGRSVSSWRWWCCCGSGLELPTDLVGALSLARMHFGDFEAASSVEHPLSAWQRSRSSLTADSVAVAGVARSVLASLQG